MSNTPSYTPKGLVKLLESKGFLLKRVKGFRRGPDTIFLFILKPKRLLLYLCITKICQKVLFMLFSNKQELTKANYNIVLLRH